MNYIAPDTADRTGLCPGCAACTLTGCVFHDLSTRNGAHREHDLTRGDRLECRGEGACLIFWVIVEGTAATCTAFEDGRRQIIGLERPGDTICALMAEAGGQSWLEALSDCRICELDLTPHAQGLRDDPEFLSATFAVVHRRLTRSQAHISTLGRLDSRERVLLFLAQMAARSDTGVVSLPMSREDIADYLGLNAETVSRILSRIKKTGLVKFLSRTEYVVPDLAEIARRLPVPIRVETRP